jgi:hypothetical protein
VNRTRIIIGIAAVLLAPCALRAQTIPSNVGPTAATMPAALQNVGFEPPLNGQMPLDLPFRDETGRDVHLRNYFGQKPVVLAFVYYNCPMICDQIRQGASALCACFRLFPAVTTKLFLSASIPARRRAWLRKRRRRRSLTSAAGDCEGKPVQQPAHFPLASDLKSVVPPRTQPRRFARGARIQGST